MHKHTHEFISVTHWLEGVVIFCKHCGLDPETAEIRDSINNQKSGG